MAYLEQSTRYVAYDRRLATGHYRYYRDPEVLDSPLGARYVGDMDRMFDTYARRCSPSSRRGSPSASPSSAGDSDFVLPPVDPGQGPRRAARPAPGRLVVQRRHLRHGPVLRDAPPAHARPPAARGAALRRAHAGGAAQGHPVVPPARRHPRARRRVDPVPGRHRGADRGGRDRACGPTPRARAPTRPWSRSSTGTPRARTRSSPPCATPARRCPNRKSCAGSGAGGRGPAPSCRPTWGTAPTAGTGPGRAFERTDYRFDIVSDYGAFRDLQRHRMLTHRVAGRSAPARLRDARHRGRGRPRRPLRGSMARSADLYDVDGPAFPRQAPYAVALAFRIRYVMQMNAREAMHVLELRSGQQGHPVYRGGAGDAPTDRRARRAPAHRRGHEFRGPRRSYDLERLDAERRAEARRSAAVADLTVQSAFAG